MRWGLCSAGVMVVLALVFEPWTLPPEGRAAAKPKAATAQDYGKLNAHTTLLGKLLVVHSDRSVVVQVEYQYYRPTRGRKSSTKSEEAALKALSREQQKILKEQEKILRMTNPARRMQELQRFVARQQKQTGHTSGVPHSTAHGPYLRLVTGKKNYVLQASDAARVRTMELPPALDARGNPRKWTDAEKRARKGVEPDLPGYRATWSGLKPGQTVRLYFTPSAAKKKDAAEQEDSSAQISMVVILDDDNEPPVAAKKK